MFKSGSSCSVLAMRFGGWHDGEYLVMMMRKMRGSRFWNVEHQPPQNKFNDLKWWRC